MEQYGNDHFNVERVLRENIVDHEYMRRTARELRTWDAVVDEIYEVVTNVEPWMSGNVRGPSTAFCLLYRLFELKPTEEQVKDTIVCGDSPYIKAVGFLYLRYVCDPRQLWSWIEPCLEDKEKFWPSGEGFGKQVTIAEYIIDLLLCQHYFETIFPRIPKKVQDDIIAALRDAGLPCQGVGNGGQGGPDRRGGDDGRARPASVKASLSVAMGQRAPNRAGVHEDAAARAKRHTPPPASSDREARYRADHDRHARSNDQSDERDRRRGPPPPRDNFRADRERDFRRGEDARARDRGRDDRGMDRRTDDRRRDWRDDRDRERGGGRGGRHDGRGGWKRDRSREQDRAPPASSVFGRSAADVFGGPPAPIVSADSLKSAYGGSAASEAPTGSVGATEEVFRIGRRR